jgi:hypothetical protein
MLRPICALLLAIASATAASAATLSVEADKLTYNVGDTITLSVSGDDEGASAYGCFGRLVYRGDIVDNGTRTQKAVHIPSGFFTKGALSATDNGVDASSDAFNQVSATGGSPDNIPEANPFATVTLIAVAVGVVDVEWDTTGPGALDYFGLTSAPGTSVTIVPEPATAALIAAGLCMFAIRSRNKLRVNR